MITRESTGIRLFLVFAVSLGISILWANFIMFIFLQIANSAGDLTFSGVKHFTKSIWSLEILFIFLAIPEEFFFRLLPLSAAVGLKAQPKTLRRVILLSSAIFGVLHGGILFIFVQGVLGVIWSVTYLKCGGYSGKILKPFLMTTAIHASYNVFVFGF